MKLSDFVNGTNSRRELEKVLRTQLHNVFCFIAEDEEDDVTLRKCLRSRTRNEGRGLSLAEEMELSRHEDEAVAAIAWDIADVIANVLKDKKENNLSLEHVGDAGQTKTLVMRQNGQRKYAATRITLRKEEDCRRVTFHVYGFENPMFSNPLYPARVPDVEYKVTLVQNNATKDITWDKDFFVNLKSSPLYEGRVPFDC